MSVCHTGLGVMALRSMCILHVDKKGRSFKRIANTLDSREIINLANFDVYLYGGFAVVRGYDGRTLYDTRDLPGGGS